MLLSHPFYADDFFIYFLYINFYELDLIFISFRYRLLNLVSLFLEI